MNRLENNQLIHLPTKGSLFTWSNRRDGNAYTQRRLDRSIYNQKCLDICSSLSCSTLLRHTSDHSPLLLDFGLTSIKSGAQFKFLKMWSLHEDCINLIRNTWNTSIFGCPMYILSYKLKILKQNLKTWNKNVFGNVHDHVSLAEQAVQTIHDHIDSSDPTNNLNQQKLDHINLDQALARQEAFWKEKSKTKWHIEGDRNATYFHRLAKIKPRPALFPPSEVVT